VKIEEKLKLFHENPVISWHEHIWSRDGVTFDVEHLENTIQTMETLGVDKAVISLPYTAGLCKPEVFTHYNNLVAEAVKRYPDKLYGMCYVDPGFTKEALYEIERCTKELGFPGGVKLYHQYTMDDPVQYALVEKCIELDIPITMHSCKLMDPEKKRVQPKASNGVHMANIARLYPEATFVMAHIGGGGDWRWCIRAIKDTPNVFTDVGGSVHDRPMIEEVVSLLGADRILFASDGGWSSAVGKVLGAEISEEEKKTILACGAFSRFLER